MAGLLTISGAAFTPPAPAVATGCSAAGSYAGGDGSSGDPWQIATADQLVSLSATPAHWANHFVQTAAIDLTNCTFTPIGEVTNQSTNPFTGTYDGQGHTLTGLAINLPAVKGVGLFGGLAGAGP